MFGSGDTFAVYGTDQPAGPGRHIIRGDLSFWLEAESIRAICWQGVEVVRGIAWPIRDENWGTLVQDDTQQSEQESEEEIIFSLDFSVGGALDCALTVRASGEGHLRADLAMTARQDFATNRAGFTILHPIAGVAGSPLVLRHSDGSTENTQFPLLVRPDQPAMDIVAMTYEVEDVEARLAFSGEIFEMEDQRNWTDASYKTYCRPLIYPFTYTIAAGETISQTIELDVSGGPTAASPGAGESRLQVSNTDAPFPGIAVAVESEWLGQSAVNEMLQAAGIRHIQARMGSAPDTTYLASILELSRTLDAEVDVEIVLTDAPDLEGQLRHTANAIETAQLSPRHVTALPESYLDSHQPSGPWPEGATPQEAALAARGVFSNAEIGGGVLTNFTEFNRCRPRPEEVDFITHGTTAIVHAADDRSVIETLEALPQVLASGAALSGGKPYRLGLVSIGMRSNPYGADVVANPDRLRCTMARTDPRHSGLFGAAWAVGALAAAADAGISGLALGAPAGPFSLFGEGDTPLPLYHLVRFAAGLNGAPVAALSGLPAGVHGFAAFSAAGPSIALANLSGETVSLGLPGVCSVRVLDLSSHQEACQSAEWLAQSPASESRSLTLAPFGIAFAEMEA